MNSTTQLVIDLHRPPGFAAESAENITRKTGVLCGINNSFAHLGTPFRPLFLWDRVAETMALAIFKSQWRRNVQVTVVSFTEHTGLRHFPPAERASNFLNGHGTKHKRNWWHYRSFNNKILTIPQPCPEFATMLHMSKEITYLKTEWRSLKSLQSGQIPLYCHQSLV